MSQKEDDAYQKIMESANEYYVGLKRNKFEHTAYWAPEQFPQIESDQVKAVVMAMIDYFIGMKDE